MVRSSTSPAPGTGTSWVSIRKSDGFGSPTGREARTTRLADCGMMILRFSSLRGAQRRSNPVLGPWIASSQGLLAMTELHPARIVRAFARDRDVLDVAFAQARAGDAHELRLVVEFCKVARADIAHRRAKPAGELMHHVADRPLVGHLALDALRHELQRILDVLLEIAVGGAARHRADRAHAAIGLVGTALPQKHLAGRLVGAGQQRADHGDVGAGGERLCEVAGIFDAAVG